MTNIWTYYVNISTEAGTDIDNAVKSLTIAQNIAADRFNQVTKFLTESDFAEGMLKTLGDHMDKFERKQNEGIFEKHVAPILFALQEIRAALIVLMDYKEADFTDIYDTFKKAYDGIGEGSITSVFGDMIQRQINTLQENKKQELTEIIKAFNYKVPTLNKKEKNFISPDENEETVFNKRFSERSIGNVEGVLNNYKEYLAGSVLDEFIGILENISKTSGKEIFEEILPNGLKNEKYKEIMDLLDSLISINKDIKLLGETKESEMDNRSFKKSASDLMNRQANTIVEITDPQLWRELQESSKTGMQKLIKNNKLLSSFGGRSLLTSMLNDVFKNLYNTVQSKIEFSDKDLTRNPGLSKGFMDAIKSKAVSVKDIFKDLNELEKHFGDPFKMKLLKEKLGGILEESQNNVKDTDDPLSNIKKELQINLEKAGFDTTISESLSTFLEALLKLESHIFSEESQNFLDSLNFEVLSDFFGKDYDAKSKTVKNIFKTLEKFTLEDENMSDKYNDEMMENEIKPDFIKHFTDAIEDRQNNSQQIMSGLYNVTQEIQKSKEYLSDRISNAINIISNLKIPKSKSTAGTISHIRPNIDDE